MDSIVTSANIVAVYGAIGAAILGAITYKYQKFVDLNFKKDELKRTAVTEYLVSIEILINHAAYSDGSSESSSDEPIRILRCKEQLNRIYIYAPSNVANAMDDLLSESIVLSTIISKIPNSKILDEQYVSLYSNEASRVNDAFTLAVNFARSEIGIHPEPVQNLQLLLLGKKD